MKFNAKRIWVTTLKPGYVVNIETDDMATLAYYVNGKFPEKAVVTIEEQKQKRSVDANAYMWVLLDKIAAKYNSTGKEVYRQIIQDVGVWTWVLVTPEAKDTFIKTWEDRGDGWVVIEYPKHDKGIPLKCYYGSSTYDTKQMSRLIDEVVQVAKDNGIEVMTPDELARIKEAL